MLLTRLWSLLLLEILTLFPYIRTYGAIRYDAKRGYGISVVDPGAVPGRSTSFRTLCAKSGGPETGSTRAIKVFCGVRNDTAGVYPEGSGNINANDNFVVANDNNREVAFAKAA